MRTRLLILAAIGTAAALGALPVFASAAPSVAVGPPVSTLNRPIRSLAHGAAVAEWLRMAATNEYLKGVIASMERPTGRRGGGCAAGDFECWKACTLNRESHGNYSDVSSSGTYRGAYQYNQGLWDGQATESGRYDLIGVSPDQASPADQDQIAADTYARKGKAPWGGRC